MIANNGHKFILANLQLSDVYDYWYKILNEYGSLTDWGVEKDDNAKLIS